MLALKTSGGGSGATSGGTRPTAVYDASVDQDDI